MAAAITRRTALRTAAGVALGAVAGGCGSRGGRRRAIVVGAGLAGLTAAVELADASWAVEVLEARERVGGRVRTWRSGGLHAELGGEFLDEGHTAVLELARDYGLALEDLRKTVRGKEVTTLAEPPPHEVTRWTSALDRLAARSDRAALDRYAAADLVTELGLGAAARAAIARELREDFGVEPERLSLAFVVASWDRDNGEVEVMRLRDGADRLPRSLARELGDAVVLGEAVEAVRAGAEGVAVRTASGRVLRGDVAVLAVPLPTLRALDVRPRLPAPVLRVGSAPIVKAALRLPDRPWRATGHSGEAVLDRATLWDATAGQPGPGGILVAYAGGEDGAEAAQAGRDTVVGVVAAAAEAAFGTPVRSRDEAVAAWSDDRWARGAYVAFAPGQWAPATRALRRRRGRLVLAGEHCSPWTGYLEGAVRSGHRAAELAREAVDA